MCKIKCKDINKNLTHFTFSILFAIYKRGKVEIIHEPSWYNKEQFPSLTSTQNIFFNEFHIQQVSGPPVVSKVNEHNIQFPIDEEGKLDFKTGKYETNNHPKNSIFKYEHERRF